MVDPESSVKLDQEQRFADALGIHPLEVTNSRLFVGAEAIRLGAGARLTTVEGETFEVPMGSAELNNEPSWRARAIEKGVGKKVLDLMGGSSSMVLALQGPKRRFGGHRYGTVSTEIGLHPLIDTVNPHLDKGVFLKVEWHNSLIKRMYERLHDRLVS